MKDVRNSDGALVAKIEEKSGAVVIVHRGCVTRIYLAPNGSMEIVNTKEVMPK